MYVAIKEVVNPTMTQRYYLVLYGDNNEVLAHSEPYYSKWNAKRASRKNFGVEPVDSTEKPYRKFP